MLEALINEASAIDFNEIVRRVLSRHTDELVALQKARLHTGKRTDGTSLPHYTSESHINKRLKAGKQISTKDLDFTGSHYGNMYARSFKDFTEMGSDDWKEGILEWAWGKDIYGLTDDDIDYLLWELGLAYEIQEEYTKELLN